MDQQLLVEILRRKDNLEDFVMFVFPWGKKGTPLEHCNGPRRWQRQILRELTMSIQEQNEAKMYETFQKAVSSGRGIGKSALVSMLTIWMLSTRIGSSVIISANSEAQLRTVTWGELSKWVAMAIHGDWWDISATRLAPKQWFKDLVEREMRKGTRYWGAEGKLWSEENPDAYAGAHNHDGMMVIFDEASGIPNSIWSVAKGYFTENVPSRFWMAFSNPRRAQGYFYECFNIRSDFWSTLKVDSRTVEDTDKKLYEGIIAEYGAESDEAHIEVYGEFPRHGDDYFMPAYLVTDAMARDATPDTTFPITMGIDPGTGSPDTTAIVVIQGAHLLAKKEYRETEAMTLVGLIIDDIEQFKPNSVAVDIGGIGWALHSRLKEAKVSNLHGVNFGWKAKNPVVWGNYRAEMWGKMREWLETGVLPHDAKLKTELLSPKKKPKSSGQMFLESKEDMRRRGVKSPNVADALALAISAPIAKTFKRKSTMYNAPIVSSWMGM